jgi:TPR repeat protein
MAAEAGNTYGIYELATCYEHGRGVKKNTAKAASLFREAALGGNRYAQFMLGRCYEGGIGIGQDKYAAVKWYKKAAAQGFKYAAQRAAALEQEFKKLVR